MPRHHERAAAIVIVLVLSLGLLSSSAWAQVGDRVDDLPPGIGIRMVDVPTERADDPRSNVYFVDHTMPGGAAERRILVSNGTDEPLPVEMRSVEASVTDGWVVGAENSAPGSIASWITVTPSSFVLAPQSTFEVEALIQVPAGTTPGERYAAIVAEPPATVSGSVDLVTRVGVRVYLSVGGDEPATDFTIDQITASRSAEGVPSVDVEVLNTGGRAIDVAGELLLTSEDGLLQAGPFPAAIQRTIGPSARGAVSVALPETIDEGPWTATATMRSGLVERVATATLLIPSASGTTAAPAESEVTGGTDEDGNDISEELRQQRRTLLPIATALLLFALAALWLLNQWRRREADERASAEAAAAGNDDARANE